MPMMSVVRVCDISGGVCGKPPQPAISSSSVGVLINFRPPMLVGDYWGTHCDDDCHPEFGAMGNPTVLVNGRPMMAISKICTAGDLAVMGSPTVYA